MKEVWYQTRILQCLNPAVMCAMADAAKTLGQELGDLHDLAFFRNRLEAEEGCRDDERIVLLGLICTRERELEQIALDLGARFFAEKPLAFERRLLRYAARMANAPGLTRGFRGNQFPQIADCRIDFLQIAPPSLERFRIDLAHERDHVAEIANPRLRQIAFLGPLVRPGRDFVELRLQPAQVGTAGAAQSSAQTNEIGNQ